MAQRVQESVIGVDVSKNTLDVNVLASEETCSIDNEVKSIKRWLDGSSGPLCAGIEPTNSYHIAFAQAAHSRGHQVYLIDPYRLAHYREGVGQRVKADHQDAQLVARYLHREAAELPLWEPFKEGPQRFRRLLKRRATLVQSVTRLRQSLTDLGSLQNDIDRLIKHCQKTIKKMERTLLVKVRALGWETQVHRC